VLFHNQVLTSLPCVAFVLEILDHLRRICIAYVHRRNVNVTQHREKNRNKLFYIKRYSYTVILIYMKYTP